MRDLSIVICVTNNCFERLKAFANVLNHTSGMGEKNTPETVVSAIVEFAVNGENDIVAERLTKALFVEPETLDALKRLDAFTKKLIDAAENNGKTSVNAKGGTK